MTKQSKKGAKKRGPDAERLKIDGAWKDAVKKAMQAPPTGKVYAYCDPEGVDRAVRVVPREDGGWEESELVEDGSIPRVLVEDANDRSRRFMVPPSELRSLS